MAVADCGWQAGGGSGRDPRVSSPDPREIAFFAHERGDARVRKRIAALRDQGWKVLGFTFHREREKQDVPPDWENIHLGTTYNRRYLQRLLAFAGCMAVLWRQRDRLGECRAIYVVNTDNALLALLGRFFAGSRAPLVLELADIQAAMLGGGPLARVFRAIERFVLARCALLVTTSPGFVREYFHPLQRHQGRIFLLENKVYPSASLPPAAPAGPPVGGGRPWVIGCFGAFRCRRSLELMRSLARRCEGRVRFVLRGYPAGTIAEDFHRLIEGGGPSSSAVPTNTRRTWPGFMEASTSTGPSTNPIRTETPPGSCQTGFTRADASACPPSPEGPPRPDAGLFPRDLDGRFRNRWRTRSRHSSTSWIPPSGGE